MDDETPNRPVDPTERREQSAGAQPPTPTAGPPQRRSVGEKFRESLAAQIVTGVLAVLLIGGIGFGIGYAVGDSGHDGGHGRHHMLYERDGVGPRERGGDRAPRERAPREQGSTPSVTPTPTPGA